ncbi:hypothetical protein ACFXTH_015123 [Malus domestica]
MLLTVEHQRHLITLLGCGFELQCQDNAPVIINMMDLKPTLVFQVYITVARQDYWATICPLISVNTGISFSLFDCTAGLQTTVADTANGNCTNKVNVPVLTTAAFEATEVSIEYAIDEGFELEIRVVEHL